MPDHGIHISAACSAACPALCACFLQIGIGQVIKGWDQGILGSDDVPPMLPGGKRRLVIPAELGYGSRGAGGEVEPLESSGGGAESVVVVRQPSRMCSPELCTRTLQVSSLQEPRSTLMWSTLAAPMRGGDREWLT